MRRIPPSSTEKTAVLSPDASAPLLRFGVEAHRGTLQVRLDPAPPDGTPIQWTQHGTPIQGQASRSLSLANLTPEDTDLYFALIGPASAPSRSQAFMVVVMPGHPLLNFSARGRVADGQPLTAGFVIGRVPGPANPRRYLIRAIGPSLERFGVKEFVADPVASLHRRNTLLELERLDSDGETARQLGSRTGAAALMPGARDFVAVAELPPGAYSLVVRGGKGSGEVLVEIYEIPAF